MFKKIAVAFDESEEAQRAFRAGLELAKQSHTQLSVITIIEPLPAYTSYVSAVAPEMLNILLNDRRTFYEDLHRQAKVTASSFGVTLRMELAEGNEVEALLNLLETVAPDLLIVGLRREPGGLSQLFGGTVHRLALHATCNMLGIR